MKVVTEICASLDAAPRHELWVSPERFAEFIQRVQGVNGLSWEWTKGVLEVGTVRVADHGLLRRFDWVVAA